LVKFVKFVATKNATNYTNKGRILSIVGVAGLYSILGAIPGNIRALQIIFDLPVSTI